MFKNNNVSNIEKLERRKHWQDRRISDDRRSLLRQRQTDTECRSGQPRRSADLGGELAEGEIWWNIDATKYE